MTYYWDSFLSYMNFILKCDLSLKKNEIVPFHSIQSPGTEFEISSISVESLVDQK